jgi:hypothetical protein
MSDAPLQFMLLIAIFIVLVFLWRQKGAETPYKPLKDHPIKVGIAIIMRKPTDVNLWFEHHRNAGISRFYVRLEDSPAVAAYLRTLEDVYFEEGESDTENNYTTFQTRQREFVNKMLPKALADGMEWLFHIDVDELLEGDVLKTLGDIPKDMLIGKLKNAEAVYAEGEPTCFSAKKFIRCDKGGPCTAYVNGKGVGRVTDGVTLGGPHDFVYKGKVDPAVTYQIPFDDLHVLHYDSCTLGTWLEKFSHMSKKAKLDDIVFPYYKKSIEVAVKAKELYKENKMREDMDAAWTHTRNA